MAEERPPKGMRYALRDLMRWLEAAGVRGAVIGGVAVGTQGRPRFTRDVDAVVALDEPQWQTFLDAGREFGFVPRIPNLIEFARRSRVLLMVHESTRIGLDLSIAGIAFEFGLIERARTEKYAGTMIRVALPEDLVVMKAIAGRGRDISDIEGLLAAHPGLDRRQVMQTVTEMAEAIDSPRIVDRLRRVFEDFDRTDPFK